MTIQENDTPRATAAEKYNHCCVDELCHKIIKSAEYIEQQWKEHHLACSVIKQSVGRDCLARAAEDMQEIAQETSIICHGD